VEQQAFHAQPRCAKEREAEHVHAFGNESDASSTPGWVG
jgi:hypothetical protein